VANGRPLNRLPIVCNEWGCAPEHHLTPISYGHLSHHTQSQWPSGCYDIACYEGDSLGDICGILTTPTLSDVGIGATGLAIPGINTKHTLIIGWLIDTFGGVVCNEESIGDAMVGATGRAAFSVGAAATVLLLTKNPILSVVAGIAAPLVHDFWTDNVTVTQNLIDQAFNEAQAFGGGLPPRDTTT